MQINVLFWAVNAVIILFAGFIPTRFSAQVWDYTKLLSDNIKADFIPGNGLLQLSDVKAILPVRTLSLSNRKERVIPTSTTEVSVLMPTCLPPQTSPFVLVRDSSVPKRRHSIHSSSKSSLPVLTNNSSAREQPQSICSSTQSLLSLLVHSSSASEQSWSVGPIEPIWHTAPALTFYVSPAGAVTAPTSYACNDQQSCQVSVDDQLRFSLPPQDTASYQQLLCSAVGCAVLMGAAFMLDPNYLYALIPLLTARRTHEEQIQTDEPTARGKASAKQSVKGDKTKNKQALAGPRQSLNNGMALGKNNVLVTHSDTIYDHLECSIPSLEASGLRKDVEISGHVTTLPKISVDTQS